MSDNFTKVKRSKYLLCDFFNGFSIGWAFVLPDAFRPALDIKLTNRVVTQRLPDGVKRKVVVREWTQGRAYDFHEGDMIHDCLEAYRLRWGVALQSLKRTVQVQSATPAASDPNDPSGWYEGTVWFKVYKPNVEKTAVIEASSHTCTQAEFVRFLKTGILRTAEYSTAR